MVEERHVNKKFCHLTSANID